MLQIAEKPDCCGFPDNLEYLGSQLLQHQSAAAIIDAAASSYIVSIYVASFTHLKCQKNNHCSFRTSASLFCMRILRWNVLLAARDGIYYRTPVPGMF